MISSRWPRPIAVMASMALMPVYSGSFTGWRWTTEGACNSRVRVSSVWTSPLPSTGRPSGSSTRPRKASPTGTERTRPVRLTSLPSSTTSKSCVNRMHPISRTSRFRATPTIPLGNSSSSLAMVPGSPSTRAMPSPAAVTAPTSSRVTFGLNASTCLLSASAISSGLMVSSATSSRPFPGSRCQLLERELQPPPHGSVDDLVPHARHHAAHHVGVDHDLDVDPFPDQSGQRSGQLLLACVVELDGGACLHHHPVPPRRRQVRQGLDPLQGIPGLRDRPADEDQCRLLGAVPEEVVHERDLLLVWQHGVAERASQGRLRHQQSREPEQLVLHLAQRSLVLGVREDGLHGQVVEHGRQPPGQPLLRD